jgi:hypothetical protein
MPAVAHRVGLRACAAIGTGCRAAVRGVAEIGRTRAAIVRLGAEAAAALAALPDTPELAAGDRLFVAAHPLAADRVRGPTVRQLRRLVARYRDECDIDRLISHLAIADAYANCLAGIADEQAGDTAHPLGCNQRGNPT